MKNKNKINKKFVGGNEIQINEPAELIKLKNFLNFKESESRTYYKFFKLERNTSFFTTSIRKAFDNKKISKNIIIMLSLNDKNSKIKFFIFEYENSVYLTSTSNITNISNHRSDIIDMLNKNNYEKIERPDTTLADITVANIINKFYEKDRINNELKKELTKFFSVSSNYCLKKYKDENYYFKNNNNDELKAIEYKVEGKDNSQLYTININNTDIICKQAEKNSEYEAWKKIGDNDENCDRHFLKFFQDKQIECKKDEKIYFFYFIEKAHGDLLKLFNYMFIENNFQINILKNIIVQSLISVAIFQNVTNYYHYDLKLENLLYVKLDIIDDNIDDLLYYKYKLFDKNYYLKYCPYIVKIFDFETSSNENNKFLIKNNLTQERIINSIKSNRFKDIFINSNSIISKLLYYYKFFDYISILSMFHEDKVIEHLNEEHYNDLSLLLELCEQIISHILSNNESYYLLDKKDIAIKILDLACDKFSDILKLKETLPDDAIIINKDKNFIIGGELVRSCDKKSKKKVLGKMRCIYKIAGDRKEYVQHKGKLITVKDYKMLNKKPRKVTDDKRGINAKKI